MQKVLPSLSRQFDVPERRYNTRRRRVFASSLGFLGFDTRRGLSPLPCSSLPFHPPPTQHKTRNMKLAWEGHHPSLCFRRASCHMLKTRNAPHIGVFLVFGISPLPSPPPAKHKKRDSVSRFSCQRPRPLPKACHGACFGYSAHHRPSATPPMTRITPIQEWFLSSAALLHPIMKNTAHMAVFFVVDLLLPSPSAENGKQAQCGTFFVFWHVISCPISETRHPVVDFHVRRLAPF